MTTNSEQLINRDSETKPKSNSSVRMWTVKGTPKLSCLSDHGSGVPVRARPGAWDHAGGGWNATQRSNGLCLI